MALDITDIFAIVYGSLYIAIVIYLSAYCWIKLEDELIHAIQKVTIEYKKIISNVEVPSPKDDTRDNSFSNSGQSFAPSSVHDPSRQFNFHDLRKQIATAHAGGSTQSSASNTFLRPIPDSYYERFIKPFDIYEDEDEAITEMDEDIISDEERDKLALPKSTNNILRLSSVSSTRARNTNGKASNSTKMGASKNANEVTFAVKFFYWVWVTWNMSSIYGLLVIHIWDMATDVAVMIKWYMEGSDPAAHQDCQEPKQWLSCNGDIDLLALFGCAILFIVLYRVMASLMIYSLTKSPLRVLSQLIFDFEIYRSIFISFKLRLSEPGYIQTWLQKLEATFESLPQAILQLSYLARIDSWGSTDIGNKVVIFSILLSLMTMAERFERDDKLYFPYHMYYITQETFPYISFPYIVRFSWRLFEVSCRIFVFVLLWLTIGGYLLSVIVVIEAVVIAYSAKKEGKYDFLSYFVAVPLQYLKEKRTWSLTFIRFMEHMVMLAIIWLNVLVDCECEFVGCFDSSTIEKRLWLTVDGKVTFGYVLLISTSAMTLLTPLLYFIIWKWYIIQDVSRLTATQERDIWVVTKTGDIRGLTEMIEFGVDPNLRNRKNETLLHVYFREYITYNQDFVDVLASNTRFYMGAMSAPGRQTILHSAVSHRMPSASAIKFLLDHGVLNNTISINDTDSDGRTAIMYYLCANKYRERLIANNVLNKDFRRDASVDVLELMAELRYGLKPEIRDKNGNCILHYAAMNPMMSDNNIEYAIDIYLNSVDRLYQDELDEIALNNAANLTREEVILYEQQQQKQRAVTKLAGAKSIEDKQNQKWEYVVGSIDVKNRFHQTPFMFYLAYNLSISNSMINLFLEHNMSPLVRDGFRNSIFHWAVKNEAINQQNGLDALRFMCCQIETYGSLMDAFEVNAKKESIFHIYFAENKRFNRDIVLLLLDFKVEINTIDIKGNTCLHYACGNVNVEMEFLIFLLPFTFKNLNLKNVDKLSPIDIYKSEHSTQQFRELCDQIEHNHELKRKVSVDRTNQNVPIITVNFESVENV